MFDEMTASMLKVSLDGALLEPADYPYNEAGHLIHPRCSTRDRYQLCAPQLSRLARRIGNAAGLPHCHNMQMCC